MSYKKDLSYRSIPYSSETPQEDFFFYDSIRNLYDKCENNKNKIIKLRTVGILKSKYGRFYLKEIFSMCAPSNRPESHQCIQVSMVHMSKSLKCLSMPYPIQLFGWMQWCSRPVIFAQIIQPLSVSAATLLHETMAKVSTLQAFRHIIDAHELHHYENSSEESE